MVDIKRSDDKFTLKVKVRRFTNVYTSFAFDHVVTSWLWWRAWKTTMRKLT